MTRPQPFPGAAEVHYPDGDGLPMAETGIHVLAMLWLIGTLRNHFRGRPDVYVIGNIFLYYEEGQPASRRSPDVMVIKGAEPKGERRSFKTWEERAVPTVVFEITSEETAEEDHGPKRELYEQLGVREYFLFDPLHEYLERPLMGYRLIAGHYEPLVPGPDGNLVSTELMLRLVPEGTQLGLYDFRTGEKLPTPDDLSTLLQEVQEGRQRTRQMEELARTIERRAREAEQRAEEERQRAGEERQRAEEERQRAEEARQQAEEERRQREQLEAELARLRAQFGGQQGPEPPPA